MTLEQQVCSLELSKRLRELGVKQESLFYWESISIEGHEPQYVVSCDEWDRIDNMFDEQVASAFTVAELGEMLPYEMADEHQDLPYFLTCEKREDPDYWIVYYNGDRGVLGGLQEEAPTEADARAAMLIYLIENNLITL